MAKTRVLKYPKDIALRVAMEWWETEGVSENRMRVEKMTQELMGLMGRGRERIKWSPSAL